MQTKPSEKDLAQEIRELKRDMKALKRTVRNNTAKGVSRISQPPYEILILDLTSC